MGLEKHQKDYRKNAWQEYTDEEVRVFLKCIMSQNISAEDVLKCLAAIGVNLQLDHELYEMSETTQEGELEELNKILQKKYDQIKRKEQRFEEFLLDDSEIILVAYGSMARVARKVVEILRKRGKRCGLLRPISLWPFPVDVFEKLLKRKKENLRFFVTEMSYGQMLEDVRLSVNGRSPIDFYGRSGGGIPTEEEILKRIL